MSESYRLQLANLLAEDVCEASERERTAFDNLASPNVRSVVLFGAGGIGRKTLAGLRAVGIEPAAFADNSPAAWGKMVDGLVVLAPDDAVRRFGSAATFVVTIWRGEPTDGMRDHIANLRDIGCETVVPFGPLYWKYAEQLLPHYAIDLPHKVLESRSAVLAAFDLLEDDASRREFVQQIAWRLTMDPYALDEPASHTMYFPPHLTRVGDDEVFVDCGAFDGDTILAFLDQCSNRFANVIGFEPDPGNLARLSHCIAGLPGNVAARVRILPYGVGDRNEAVGFSAEASLASAVNESGGSTIECVTLDSALTGTAPSYVKIDIEGYEPKALRGAVGIMRESKPVLAVCSYHKQSHIWEIPALIHELAPDYALAQVRYAVDAWETVTYAIPRDRLLRQEPVQSAGPAV